ncbi:MAG: 3-phosphoserine/phosphohydroxythreonine transaminase [Eubacteriales bacterium]
MNRVYNFSAGPSMLPLSVLEQAGKDITNYKGSGMSVMEMSHRSKVFIEIFENCKANFRNALNIPEEYEILFLQTGATGQFSMIPLNFLPEGGSADYIVTGNFSNLAMKEAKKYGTIHITGNSEDKNHTYIPKQEELNFSDQSSYLYYCANNTIYGTQWQYVPESSAMLCCDMSSDILSRPIDVSKYGLIMAGAQKNMAPAGLTMVIVKKDILGKAREMTPVMMDYNTMAEKDSMYNTPPCWCIYMLGLTLDWVKAQGGVEVIEQYTTSRAKKLYDALDNSKLFSAPAQEGSRSSMNVVFRTGKEDLDDKFVKEATAQGFVNLKGHRNVGGMRASIYNAFPTEGVDKLIEMIQKFEQDNK